MRNLTIPITKKHLESMVDHFKNGNCSWGIKLPWLGFYVDILVTDITDKEELLDKFNIHTHKKHFINTKGK